MDQAGKSIYSQRDQVEQPEWWIRTAQMLHKLHSKYPKVTPGLKTTTLNVTSQDPREQMDGPTARIGEMRNYLRGFVFVPSGRSRRDGGFLRAVPTATVEGVR